MFASRLVVGQVPSGHTCKRDLHALFRCLFAQQTHRCRFAYELEMEAADERRH